MRMPSFQPPPIKRNDATRVETRRYKLITPLFGGGVEPQKADPITVVRASEIRGHLRFWWRATRGGQYPSLAALREAEGALWGDTERPSLVSIETEIVQRGQSEVAFTVKNGKPEPSGKIHPYAAFPLLPTDNDRKKLGWQSNPVRIGVEFAVTFRMASDDYERHKADLEAALWAWETFGGIGGRTRRGFGAIQRADDAKPRNKDDVRRLIEDGLRKHVVPTPPVVGVPHLTPEHQAWKLTDAGDDAIEVWKRLIDKLRSFRQYRVDKNGKRNEYGKSVWPEPDAIRAAARSRSSAPPPAPFPRAVLGLPIIFHFPQDKTPDATLVGRQYERMASPLILRPVACGQGAVGLALALSAPRRLPGGLQLKSDKEGYSGEVSDRDLKKAEAQKVEPLKGETDVLAAFLAWV